MAEWFESWFESEEYLKVYKHRDEREALQLVESIISITNIKNKSKILDLACGAGRHSIEFAKKGFLLTAVDLSENLLNNAKVNAQNAEVDIDFIRADIRDFYIDDKFDLVLNLFTSFGYFESDEENFKVFKSAYDHLNENGFFIFDYFNKKYLEENLIPNSSLRIEDGEIIQKRRIEKGRVIKDIIIKKNGNEKYFKESVKIYSLDEIKSKLELTKFNIKDIYGSFDRSKFDESLSNRIIIIAQK
ncbi:MAG: class I SAM-dependent methyltransferase [Bacteroidetes bacterium]|nr:class I SAM-dependent methyltransferase [Bacteroidota bacterium]MCH8169647.1 class I SAM-dependent methyltransferase [Bacteroidota bacterium]MCH8941773.1 class I SAM-dependent methyltransferase [Bacteroidota bacterium]